MQPLSGHFRLVPFHTSHGKAGINGAKYSPADGGNATLMDTNCHKTLQEEDMGRLDVYIGSGRRLLF